MGGKNPLTGARKIFPQKLDLDLPLELQIQDCPKEPKFEINIAFLPFFKTSFAKKIGLYLPEKLEYLSRYIRRPNASKRPFHLGFQSFFLLYLFIVIILFSNRPIPRYEKRAFTYALYSNYSEIS